MVVILGILAAIVIVQFVGVADDAERTAFISSAKTFVDAAERYRMDYGTYPNAAPGRLPPGFGDYITYQHWERVTPIGGLWDTAVDAFGVEAAIGVFYGAGAPSPHRDDVYMQQIDALVDDGDLSTGSFQKMSSTRYFFILAF